MSARSRAGSPSAGHPGAGAGSRLKDAIAAPTSQAAYSVPASTRALA
jgi:hypothetical protein